MRIFGREPQWWAALFGAIVIGVSTFIFPLTADEQGVLNSVVLAVIAIVVAVAAKSGTSLALVVNLTKALLALVIAFGLHLSPDAQAAIMTIVMAVGSGFLRTQITAPVDANGRTVAVTGGTSV